MLSHALGIPSSLQALLFLVGAVVARWAYRYPDDETLARALVAPAGVALQVGPEREGAIKDAIVEGLADHRQEDGSYRLENEYRYLVARRLS